MPHSNTATGIVEPEVLPSIRYLKSFLVLLIEGNVVDLGTTARRTCPVVASTKAAPSTIVLAKADLSAEALAKADLQPAQA